MESSSRSPVLRSSITTQHRRRTILRVYYNSTPIFCLLERPECIYHIHLGWKPNTIDVPFHQILHLDSTPSRIIFTSHFMRVDTVVSPTTPTVCAVGSRVRCRNDNYSRKVSQWFARSTASMGQAHIAFLSCCSRMGRHGADSSSVDADIEHSCALKIPQNP